MTELTDLEFMKAVTEMGVKHLNNPKLLRKKFKEKYENIRKALERLKEYENRH